MKKQMGSLKTPIVVIISIILIVVSVVAFLFSYEKMKDTMALEREEYVSELTNQVVAKVNATINKNLDEVVNYANLINQVSPNSFKKMKDIFNVSNVDTEEDRMLLLSKEGRVYQLNGNTIRVSDTGFLSDIGSSEKVSSAFSPLGTLGDYWLFGSPIKPVSINGINMIAVIRANKNTTFSEEMTVSMFEQNTFSFLVSDSSNIFIKPENATGYGSNLINSLSYSGLSKEDKTLISDGIKTHKMQSNFFTMNNEQWLIQTAYVRDDYSVALLLPLRVTSSETIRAMNQTMLLVVVLLLIAMASIILLVMIMMRSRSEKRIQEEKFRTDLVMKTAQNKTDFLSKMSHDIRTPLNGIIGMSYLAADNLHDPLALEDNITKIQSSADYLLSLVNDILDMSKIDSGKFKLNLEAANIEDILYSTISRFEIQAKEQKLELKFNCASSLPDSYLFDKLRVNQVLMNLLSNAVKFTPSGGKVVLALKLEPLSSEKDPVIFTVSDTGVGMTEEFMKRIFMAFEQESELITQQYGGSGLGLSIVKKLVDLMDGTVSVESKIDVGTCFTVSLPMKKTVKRKEEQLESASKNINREGAKKLLDKNVLVVEDHPINAQIATKLLEKWGLKVTIAENGKIGVEQFTKSAPGFFSMIFMDIRMPVMDGFAATKAIRESEHVDGRSIPIYAMSANAFAEDVEKSLAVGMNGHLRKPIEIPVLKEVIEENLLMVEDV